MISELEKNFKMNSYVILKPEVTQKARSWSGLYPAFIEKNRYAPQKKTFETSSCYIDNL